jgi:type II restriction enzyme
MYEIECSIKLLADKYSDALAQQIKLRTDEMRNDNKSHYLIYEVLGIDRKEGELIDLYQNKGRFLYKYAGSFLEEATILCFKNKFQYAQEKVRIKNSITQRPKTIEIDCLINNNAFEIKWRDATTDGDHITKEHTRIKVIQKYGYKPIRLMFYEPNREQAIKVQETLKTMYLGIRGRYYSGNTAWEYVKEYTNIDLKQILNNIIKSKHRGG